MSRLAPTAPVPLTTGVPAEAVFAFAATLRSPGFLTFFAFAVLVSPGLLVVPSPSDFMVDAALQEEEVGFSDTLLVLCTGGLSGVDEGHFTARDCELVNTGFLPSLRLSPLSIASASILSLCFEDRDSHPCVWRTA